MDKADTIKRIVISPDTQDSGTVRISDDVSTVRINIEEKSESNRQNLSSSNIQVSRGDFHSLYAIQAKIGGGGMGVVYLAKELRLDRFVAVKRLNAASNCDAALRKRFLNEAHAVAALNHIHIVHIYALGEDEEGPYIVMEYVEGPANVGVRASDDGSSAPNPPCTLEAQVEGNGQYTLTEAVNLVVKLAKAVAYAHSNGVIHRDLKPANILLDSDGEPKIVDFGLARMSDTLESKLTRHGEKLLSIGYGAPEQEADASVSDERADVYGLGGILFFAITGQNPRYFREQDTPLTIREALVKALATDREQRWASVQEFLEALTAIQSRTRVDQAPAKTTWRCKWCDTLNPVSIRFCSECGWDGVELCPECGTENIVGMQFCGKCGADIRVYNSIQSLLNKATSATASKEYEKVISIAARVQGFEPAGPSGRMLANKLNELSDSSKENIQRREQLKELIPMELKAENFERTGKFIEEYRRLSDDHHFYKEEYNELADKITQRDLKRAYKAYRSGDIVQARMICEDIRDKISPDNSEYASLKRKIFIRKLLSRSAVWVMILSFAGLLYLMSMPIYLRAVEGNVKSKAMLGFYRPLQSLYTSDSSFINDFFKWWRGFVKCDEGYITDFTKEPAANTEAVTPEEVSPEPDELKAVMEKYHNEILNAEKEYQSKLYEISEHYITELEKLINAKQMSGDFDAYQQADAEHNRYLNSRELVYTDDETSSIFPLQQQIKRSLEKYKSEYNKSRIQIMEKTVSSMGNMLSMFTKENKIEAARSVNNELMKLNGELERLKGVSTSK